MLWYRRQFVKGAISNDDQVRKLAKQISTAVHTHKEHALRGCNEIVISIHVVHTFKHPLSYLEKKWHDNNCFDVKKRFRTAAAKMGMRRKLSRATHSGVNLYDSKSPSTYTAKDRNDGIYRISDCCWHPPQTDRVEFPSSSLPHAAAFLDATDHSGKYVLCIQYILVRYQNSARIF